MRFLTLSSAQSKLWNSQMLNLALFAGTFLPLTIVTMVLWLVVPHQPMQVAAPPPASDDYYLALDGPIACDERVLFHGEYDTPKYLKGADVLLLGNSRLMFGFPRDPFQKLFQRFNLSYYMLGFGHNERDVFPRELIRKFDLHPTLVIVNADYFFVGTLSRVGGIVFHESYFEARKQLFEGETTYVVRNQLHAYLPHWLSLCEDRREFIVHRSRSDGTWLAPDGFRNRFPVPELPGDRVLPMEPHHLELARQFKAEMNERGAQVILTFVPSQHGNREFAERFARHLDVPLISPRLQGLETFDMSHLNPQSARRFTEAFLLELEGVLRPTLSSPSLEHGPASPASAPESDVARSGRKPTVR